MKLNEGLHVKGTDGVGLGSRVGTNDVAWQVGGSVDEATHLAVLVLLCLIISLVVKR